MGLQKLKLRYPDLLSIQEVTWDQAREYVIKADPGLAKIIDQLKLTLAHTLLLAKFPYGVDIRRDGKGYFPTENGKLATLDDPNTSPKVKKLLSYSNSPLGLILNKATEVYVETHEQRSIPFKLFKPGTTFGVWEIMDSPEVSIRQGWDWSISSGARTIFMPCSINNSNRFTKLKRAYDIKAYPPASIFDHRNIFMEIAEHAEAHWCTEVLFFTGAWLENSIKNANWYQLHDHWSRQAWSQLLYWSNKMIIEYNWEHYISELALQKISLKPYLLDTVRHLINIASGTVPGFRITDDSETVIPSSIVQHAFIHEYGLKTYSPILMQPDFLDFSKETDFVYYSLQYPTLPEKPSEFQSLPSTMKLIRELKHLVEIFLEVLSRWNPCHIEGKSFDLLDHIEFEFFHSDQDIYQDIAHISQMLEEDPSLSAFPKAHLRQFPESAHFFKGCVRVGFHR